MRTGAGVAGANVAICSAEGKGKQYGVIEMVGREAGKQDKTWVWGHIWIDGEVHLSCSRLDDLAIRPLYPIPDSIIPASSL